MIAQSVAAFPKQEGLSVAVLVAYLAHMLQRIFPAGFIAPCLPTKTDKLPSGDLWLHEIKHDGFRRPHWSHWPKPRRPSPHPDVDADNPLPQISRDPN